MSQPAPAPTAAPTPPPSPSPSPASSRQPAPAADTLAPASASDDFYADLRSLSEDETDVTREKPAPKPSAPKPAPKPADKPKDEKPGSEESPGEDEPALDWSKSPRAFRATFEKASRRVKELEGEVARLKSGQPSEEDRRAMDERLTAAEKLAKEREERLQQVDYERSDAYRDAHIKPLQNAFESAYSSVKSLKIMTPEGEEVQMTESHFNALIRMSDDQAEETAATWFGDNAKGVLRANRILDMRRNILTREQARQEALKNHMSTREQREREHREASEREMGKRREVFHSAVKEGMERHPEFFKPADDDPKGKELFTKGMSIADMAFTAEAPVAPEKVPKLHAAIRNKAGAFDYVAYRLRVANREIAKLQERLDAYQKSDPADPMGNRGGMGREGEQSPEQEIRALATD